MVNNPLDKALFPGGVGIWWEPSDSHASLCEWKGASQGVIGVSKIPTHGFDHYILAWHYSLYYSQTLIVWYIYLHLLQKLSKCR